MFAKSGDDSLTAEKTTLRVDLGISFGIIWEDEFVVSDRILLSLDSNRRVHYGVSALTNLPRHALAQVAICPSRFGLTRNTLLRHIGRRRLLPRATPRLPLLALIALLPSLRLLPPDLVPPCPRRCRRRALDAEPAATRADLLPLEGGVFFLFGL